MPKLNRHFYLLIIATAIAIVAGLSFHNLTKPKNATTAMAMGKYRIAATYYETAALAGDLRAANSLANLYYLGLGVDQNYDRASQLYLQSAAAGVADAQLNLGNMFKQGLGVAFDPMRAFAWYNMADVHGNPAAEFYMKQITQEWTLSPLQINTALNQWSKLPMLVESGLN